MVRFAFGRGAPAGIMSSNPMPNGGGGQFVQSRFPPSGAGAGSDSVVGVGVSVGPGVVTLGPPVGCPGSMGLAVDAGDPGVAEVVSLGVGTEVSNALLVAGPCSVEVGSVSVLSLEAP